MTLNSVTGSGRALLTSAARITGVEACPDDPYPDYVKLSAEVELYGFFGSYYDTLEADCGGDEILVPKRPEDGL